MGLVNFIWPARRAGPVAVIAALARLAVGALVLFGLEHWALKIQLGSPDLRLGLLALIVAAAGLILISRVRAEALKPAAALTRHLDAMATGDHDAAPPHMDKDGALGELARSIEGLRKAACERRRLRLAHEGDAKTAEDQLLVRSAEAEQRSGERAVIIDMLGDALERLAIGDLSIRLHTHFPPALDQVRIDFNASMEALGGMMDSILEATQGVSLGAGELSQAAGRLSSRTDQQAASVRDSAGSLVQLRDEVARTTDYAEEVLVVADSAKSTVEDSSTVMQQASAAMVRIEASSGHISRISEVINEIAFQTNMLALNAGVEAARAGESGRGFAVVAAEVRALSQRTGNAAREISDLAANAHKEIAAGVTHVTGAGDLMTEIVERVGRVSELVVGIAHSSRAQTQSIGAITHSVRQIDEITRDNVNMVAEATSASQVLADEASGLTTSIARFKGQVVLADDEPGAADHWAPPARSRGRRA